MARIHRLSFRATSQDDDFEDANRQTASLAGLAVALLLVVVSLFLIRQLARHGAIEDCLMSGRTNCFPVATPHR